MICDSHLTRMDQGIRVMREVIQAEKPFTSAVWSDDLDQLIAQLANDFDAEHLDDKMERGLISGNLHPPRGIVACGVGWMAHDPWHRRQGLKLGIDQNGDVLPIYRLTPSRLLLEWDAVAAYFCIGPDEARTLFGMKHDGRQYTRAEDLLNRMIAFRAEMQIRYDREADIPF